MTNLRPAIAIFSAMALAGILLPFSGGVALAETGCQCYCVAVKNELATGAGSGYGAPVATTVPKTGTPADIGSVSGADLQAAQNACRDKCADPKQVAVPQGADYNQWNKCTQAGCWCKGKDGPYLKEQNSQEGCKETCKSLGQEFAGWGNTLPSVGSSGTGGACPPGGLWTQEECNKAVNEDGVKIGLWDPPSGIDKGPYCFYNNTPIKIGVSIGGLTQATLAQYLAAAYRLGLGVAAVLAVIFIMVGGFRYMSAAGGAGIEAGKEMIKNAVVGLVLAALSYTLLQTVNPDILKLTLPRVNLVKSCTMVVDCGTRKDQKTCEDNSKDSTKRCMWITSQSICVDNSVNQADAMGKIGGECKKNAAGEFECAGGMCVNIGGNNYRCTTGDTCQPCVNDTPMLNGAVDPNGKGGCQAKGGLPVMCIDNQCAQINPAKPPTATSYSKDNYLSCSNTRCSSDSDCASGKCNSSHYCSTPNQGTRCATDNDCDTKQGFKCTQLGENPVKYCCDSGDPQGCLGCNNDSDCSATKSMFCMTEERFSFVNKERSISEDYVKRCVGLFSDGDPCAGSGSNTANAMCKSNQCFNDACSGDAKTVDCSANSSAIRSGKYRDADEYCQYTLGVEYFCADNRFWPAAMRENPNYGKVGLCVKKTAKGQLCCNDVECGSGTVCTNEPDGGTCQAGTLNKSPGMCD